jgi:hypothetical protein
MRQKYYTIYKITNQSNGKYYIGSHITEDPNDNYYGSGNLITEAIRKYGKDKFTKEILFMAFSEKDMDWAEEKLVVLKEQDSKSYNLICGGNRPPSKRNKTSFKKGHETWNRGKTGLQKHSEEWKEAQSKRMSGKKAVLGKHWNRSDEAKLKQSISMAGKNSGSMWVNDGEIEKMIKKNMMIPENFVKGRL